MPFQISRDGQMYGPYTIEDVKRYVASGNILPTDLARDEAGTDWLPVSLLLSASAAPPAIEPAAFGSAPAWQPEPSYAQQQAVQPQVAEFPLFPVSTPKFIVMMLVTFGLYQIYWTYKQWARYEAATGDSIMPWARAIFAGIWNFALFDRVKNNAAGEEIPVAWNPILLAASVIVLAGVGRIWHRVSFVSLFVFLPYLPVVGTIERMNARVAAVTEETLNTRFSAWNIAGVVVGGIFLVLAILGWIAIAMGRA